LYVFDNWGKNLSHKKGVVKLQNENIYPKGRADPDNQLSDRWSSTVTVVLSDTSLIAKKEDLIRTLNLRSVVC